MYIFLSSEALQPQLVPLIARRTLFLFHFGLHPGGMVVEGHGPVKADSQEGWDAAVGDLLLLESQVHLSLGFVWGVGEDGGGGLL